MGRSLFFLRPSLVPLDIYLPRISRDVFLLDNVFRAIGSSFLTQSKDSSELYLAVPKRVRKDRTDAKEQKKMR